MKHACILEVQTQHLADMAAVQLVLASKTAEASALAAWKDEKEAEYFYENLCSYVSFPKQLGG